MKNPNEVQNKKLRTSTLAQNIFSYAHNGAVVGAIAAQEKKSKAYTIRDNPFIVI